MSAAIGFTVSMTSVVMALMDIKVCFLFLDQQKFLSVSMSIASISEAKGCLSKVLLSKIGNYRQAPLSPQAKLPHLRAKDIS